MINVEIKETQERKSLNEGRNFGLGYAFLKRKTKKKFITVNALTACKDYLNDIVYIENTKEPLKKIHGFKHNYEGLLENKRFFFLGINTLERLNGNSWDKLEKCKKELIDNKHILEFNINKLEDKLKMFKSRTTLLGVTNNTLILRVPIFWSKTPFLISLYTLYIRCIFNKSDKINDIEKDIVSHSPFIDGDTYLKANIVKFFAINKLKKQILNYKYPSNNDVSNIHNGGIHNWILSINKKK